MLFSYLTNSDNKHAEEINNILLNEIADYHTPSVQYYIFTSDSIIHSFSSGYADVKNEKLTGNNTTYHIFSITKTFTAIAVLQLAERGLLDINSPVKNYLSGFPYQGNITVKNLLTHTAGIPNPIPLKWIHTSASHKKFNRDEFFSGIYRKYNSVCSEPGEEFSYSNLGYVLLGQLIEKFSGKTYEQYIRENIINRLGLKPGDMDFTVINPANHAKGYVKYFSLTNFLLGFLIDKSEFMDNREGEWKPFKNFYVNGASYGGLISTPPALVRYIQEFLKPEILLLSSNSLKLMFSENRTNDIKLTVMCLSWFTGTLEGNKYFTHAGGGGGYYSEIRIYPNKGIGSVIMLNRTGISDERYLDNTDKYILR